MKSKPQMPKSASVADSGYIPCVVCKGMNHTVVFGRKNLPGDDLTYSLGIPELLGSQVVWGNGCGLIFFNPRKGVAESTSGYSEAEELGYSPQWRQRVRTFERKLRLIERFKAGGSILDVGCASGAFLQVARGHGWRTFGVELNHELVKIGQRKTGIEIFNGRLEDANIPRASYDVVTMFDVIEHLPQPVNTLRIIHSILNDNGLLVINFPDADSFTAIGLVGIWWFCLEDHLYYFGVPNLSLLLEITIFVTVSVQNHFQSLDLGYLL